MSEPVPPSTTDTEPEVVNTTMTPVPTIVTPISHEEEIILPEPNDAPEPIPKVEGEELPVAPSATETQPVTTQTETQSEVPEPELSIRSRKSQNVTLDSQIFYPLSDDETDDDDLGVSLPSDTDQRTSEVLNMMPNISIGGTKPSEKWAAVTQRSLGMTPYEDTFTSTLEDEHADFGQSIEQNGHRFGAHAPSFAAKQNTTFDGDMGVLRMMSHLGLGTAFNTPLVNTGIWVTFKPPAEEDLVELFRQLTSDQIEMGRTSYGMVYSHTSVYVIDRMCRFAAQHIYRISANPESITASNILQYIKTQDIPSFLWGFACTMYPKGFMYTRACMINPDKCQHVVKELVNLRKLQVINRAELSEQQRVHLAENRSAATLTAADLKRYESQLIKAASRRIVINEGKRNEISFTLRSPSILEYIESGHRWIDDMVSMVEQVLGASASVKEKNELIELKSRATIIRQYSHYIDKIEFDSNRIEDRATVEKTISNISADPEIREKIIEKIKHFIETSSISVIGVPTYDCPACGVSHEGPENFPHKASLIPIDVVQLFFVLLTQKHQDLRNR